MRPFWLGFLQGMSWPFVWLLFGLGCIAARTGPYRLYNWLMIASADLQDRFEVPKGPWKPVIGL